VNGREARLIFATGMAWMFDAMDVLLLSFILVAASHELGLTKGGEGLIMLVNNVGMLIGAFLFGWLADLWGRRPTFMLTLALYSLGMGLTAFVSSASELAAVRFFTGLGLGGELPVVSSFVSELSPPDRRGRNVVLLESFWSVGVILAAAIAYLAFPRFGWRAPLLALSAVALYALAIRTTLPESPQWLRLRDPARAQAIANEYGVTLESAGRHSARELLTDGLRTQTLVLWASWLLLAFGYYGIFLWLPTMLVRRGYSIVKAFGYSLAMDVIELPGYFTAAYLIERLGRKPSLLAFMTGYGAATVAFALAPSTAWLLASGGILNFFNGGAWGLIYAYTPESFPSDLRGTGMGSSGSMARVGMIVGPLLPVFVSFSAALSTYAAALLATGALIYALGIETKPRR
jgi:putative MFS transporter